MTKHKPKLKVGQVWRSRGGETVTIDSKDNHPSFPFFASCGDLDFMYPEDGRYWNSGHDSDHDLVELISDAPESKARTNQEGKVPKEDITLTLTENEVSYLNHCLDIVSDAGVEEDDQAVFEVIERKIKDLYEEHCASYRLSPAMEAYHAKYGTFGTSRGETPRWEAFRDAFNAGMEAARASSDG